MNQMKLTDQIAGLLSIVARLQTMLAEIRQA